MGNRFRLVYNVAVAYNIIIHGALAHNMPCGAVVISENKLNLITLEKITTYCYGISSASTTNSVVNFAKLLG